MSLSQGKGYSPAHITLFFSIADLQKDPLYCGSKGGGFCLAKGVTSSVSRNRHLEKSEIYINQEKSEEAKVSLATLFFFEKKLKEQGKSFDLLKTLTVHHQIEVPQGSGFGTSGAGALSLAFALNQLFDYPFNSLQLAQIAHLAEIKEKTGLGTIAGEALGGMEIREKEGAPGFGIIQSLPIPSDLRCHLFYIGTISTKKSLQDPLMRMKIIQAGNKAMEGHQKITHWREMAQRASLFTLETQILTPDLEAIYYPLAKMDLNPAMLMFGQGIHILYEESERKKIEKAVKTIQNLDYNFPKLQELDLPIDLKGARYEF